MLVRPGGELPITFRPGRRLGQARVLLDGHGLPGDERTASSEVPLSYALLRLNQTQVGRRFPVLVPASRAATDDLRKTFSGRNVSMVVPVTAAQVWSHGRTRDAFVLWLDRRQIDVMDAARPSRPRELVLPDRARVTLPSGEVLGGVYSYEHSRLADAPPDLTYDLIMPAALSADVDPDQLPDGLRLQTIAPSGTFDGFGQAVVRLSRADLRRLGPLPNGGEPRHLTVRPVTRYRGDVEALGRILIRDDDAPGAEVDEVLREAIGVEIGEDVILKPVEVRRRRWPDLWFGRPAHVTCRVQTADLSTLEREVCLLDELTLELLGVSSGDEVVIDGLDDGGTGVVESIRMRAFATSATVRHRRQDLDGGDFGARFPSARDALGVYPDLPWVFLVDTTRDNLRLRAPSLATVRVRSSRVFQLRKELREMALLLGIAFIGVLQLIDDQRLRVTALVALLVVVGSGIVVRMRGRLSYRVRKQWRWERDRGRV